MRGSRQPVLVVALAVVVVAVPPAGAQLWTELGPAPIENGSYTGRVSAIAVSPTDPDRYFVAGADGGVWRSSDGGSSWGPVSDSLPTTAMGALALDPTDEDVIYAGTGEANYANHSRYGLGLFRSRDGGDSWQSVARGMFAGRCFSRILIDPLDVQVVYAAITRAGGFPELAAAKRHPRASARVGVFRSGDGGTTWQALSGGLPALSATDLAMDPANPAILYAAIGRIFGDSRNGIYKSSDGGSSWTKLGGGLPTSDVGRISVAVAPSDGSRLYALVTEAATASGGSASTRGIYRSTSGGSSWSRISSNNIQATYGWYLSVVSIHPTDPDIALFGGLSLVRTTNGGSSFRTVTPPHVDMHALAWDAAGRLLAGDDGGVHRSSSRGDSWVSLNDGLGIVQFYAGISLHPTDARIVFGGTQDNGSNRRTTDDRRWTRVYGGDGGWTQLDATAPNRVFVEWQGTANLYRSTNGGGSFSWVGSGIHGGDRNCFLPPYLIDPTDPGRMLYATQRVYRSTDGGTSWSSISGDLSNGSGAIRAFAMSPSDPSVVYAATNDGNVQASFDGGSTFQLRLAGHPGWPRVTRELLVHPDDPQRVYLATAVFGTDQVQRSWDGGQSWESLDGTLPDLPVNVLAVDVRQRPHPLYAGTDRGLFSSLDDGVSWHRYGTGLPPAPVIDLRLDPARQRLVAATQGRGAWSVPLLLSRDPQPRKLR